MVTTASRNRPATLNAVAAVGSVVAMLGIGHAMYDALTDSPGLHPAAFAEAAVAAVFLELVVATCAARARAHADNAQAARLDVAVVLVAALLSGVVSGIHVGWSTAGLFRLAVPVIAALVWLGDVVTALRLNQETDHERALRSVVAAVGRRVLAEHMDRWRDGRLKRADVALVRAISVYAAADGDREQLVRRVNEVHHRTDLLRPLGPSPWRTAVSPFALSWMPLPPVGADCPGQPGQLSPDPLLPEVKALLSAVPDIGRPALVERLREQGHRVGNDRAAELLRTARTAALNGHERRRLTT